MRNLTDSFQLIESIQNAGSIFIKGIPFISEGVNFDHEENHFSCSYNFNREDYKFFDPNNLLQDNDHCFSFECDGYKYLVEKDEWMIRRYNPFNPESFNLHFNIYQFRSENFPKKDNTGLFRYVSKVAESFTLKDFEFRGIEYLVPENRKCGTLECILFKIEDNEYQLYLVKFNKRKYLIIENSKAVELSKFEDTVSAIIFSIGFVDQWVPLDETYIMQIDDNSHERIKALRFQSLRKSIKGQYPVFTTNAYSVIEPLGERNHLNTLSLSKEWSSKLPQFSTDALVKLISLILQEPRLYHVIIMLIEGSKAGLESQGVIFAGALENLTEVIKAVRTDMPEIKGQIEEDRWESLRQSFLLENEKSILTAEEKKFVKNKLETFNSASNNKKLTAPFTLLGIPLTSQEKNIINKRNVWLHGRNILNLNRSTINKEIYDCKMMHRLISSLLLKLIDFNGYVIDNCMFDADNLSIEQIPSVFRHI